jgi:hypothetical protein
MRLKIIPAAFVVAIFVLGMIAVSPNSSAAHNVKAQFVLHPTATFAINSTYWTPYPNNGIYWDKLISNDGNTTYIKSSSSGSFEFGYFTMANLNYKLEATDRIIVSTYAYVMILSGPLSPTAYHQFLITIKTASNYDSSFMNKMYQCTAKNVWQNMSVSMNNCPWTGKNWTTLDVNDTMLKIWVNGLGGVIYYGEVAMLITILSPSSTGIVISLETIGIIVTLAIGAICMIFGLRRREFNLMAGLTWLFGGIFYMTDVNVGFTIISIGLGFILLLSTAVDYLENRDIKH